MSTSRHWLSILLMTFLFTTFFVHKHYQLIYYLNGALTFQF